ncbi:MAG: flagellar biosynthesis anti-sigma factor FlgM [Pseudomonadota bacterium]
MKGITGNPVLDAYQRGGVSKVGAAKPAEQAGPAAPSAGGGPSSAAVEVSISPAARDLAANTSQPIDHAKVEDVKNKISQGTLHIDSKVVAQRLLNALG